MTVAVVALPVMPSDESVLVRVAPTITVPNAEQLYWMTVPALRVTDVCVVAVAENVAVLLTATNDPGTSPWAVAVVIVAVVPFPAIELLAPSAMPE